MTTASTNEDLAQGSAEFECDGCGSLFVVIPKLGNDIEDVEYCPFCGSGSIERK